MGIASMPTVTVEIGFNATPKTASGSITWTDVSNYVDSIEITRGRVDETRPFEAGHATIHLINNDRRFDPNNTAGPYYGSLLPRRPIRVKATWSAVTYTVFRGWTEGFPVEFTNAGKECFVTLECFDALGLLGVVRTGSNAFESYVLSKTPRALWEMGDRDGSFTVLDTVEPTVHLLARDGENETKLRGPSIIPQVLTGSQTNLSENNLKTVDSDYGGRWQKNTTSYLAFWFQTLWRTGDTSSQITFYNSGAGLDSFLNYVLITDRVYFYQQFYDISLFTLFTSQIALSSVKVNDGKPHFCVIKNGVGSANQVEIWIDGVLRGRLGSLAVGYISATPWATKNEFVNPYIGSTAENLFALQYVGLFSSLDNSSIKEMYDRGVGYLRETSSARFSRLNTIADLSQIPISAPTIGTEQEVGYLDFNARNVLELMQQTAVSDNGELYAKADGTLQFYGRDGVLGYKTTSTVATFSTSDIKFRGDLAIEFNAEQVRNVVVVDDSFGQQVQAIDATSYNTYGESSEVINSICADETVAANVAVRRVQLFKDAKTQISEFVVDPQVDTSKWATMLSLDLLDQISLTIAPPSGSTITATMLVQQLRHEITPARWAIGILGSQRMTGYFIADASKADSTDKVL